MTNPTAAPEQVQITQPGIYNLPAEAYHADPVPGGSLSSTGARKLLPPSCPALFHHWRENGDGTKKAWDIGHAAHAVVLGTGPELVLVDRDRWDTKEVKAQLAEIRDRGAVPLKRAEWEQVHAMADALRAHPWAGKLFAPGTGKPEQVLIWQETATVEIEQDGQPVARRVPVMCRALVDWLRDPPAPGRRYLLPDYKSTGAKHGASPGKLGRTIADFGYYIQLGFYLRGLRALGLASDDARGLLVVQETAAPYLVTVAEPDHVAMRLAELRIREALDTYARCTLTGRWNGYADDVVVTELPPWETRELNGEIW